MGRKKLSSTKSQDESQAEKIKSLQEMIATAEKTIISAKAMLSQVSHGNDQDFLLSNHSGNQEGEVIQGIFDGQIMVSQNGKQYPVPANYASKSKLVEGDLLKLTITDNGSFVYKQIGPVERKYLIGIAQKDARGNFMIKTEEKTYQVLLAAATYFKVEPGDEITIVVPQKKDSVWGAIENVIKKASSFDSEAILKKQNDLTPKQTLPKQEELVLEEDEKDPSPSSDDDLTPAVERLKEEIEQERKNQSQPEDILDEWTPDISILKKEATSEATAKTEIE